MTKQTIKNFAVQNTPAVNVIKHDDFYRHDVLSVLENASGVGIELGVAGGHFSKRMVQSGKFSKFYGVDLYEDHHDIAEYKNALKLVGMEQNYVLLRMSFDDACDLFEDDFFDFIYFDGYAHTGEEGGKTFADWYRKLKVGGVFAGDDYHEKWPLVQWAVNDMVSQLGCDLHLTGRVEHTHLNRYPSWFFQKPSEGSFRTSPQLLDLGRKIRKSTRKPARNISLSMDDVARVLKTVKTKNPAAAQDLRKLL